LASAASTAAIQARVAFCNEIGLDYVSCSPYRVPVARLAAAQAALEAAAEQAALEAAAEAAKAESTPEPALSVASD